MLTDTFQRVHDYLRVSLTDRCNLRCSYCMPEENMAFSPQEHLMNANEIFTLSKIFADEGVRKIRLTGGEPLIRKDAAEIISQLAELPVEMAITTNGVRLGEFLPLFSACGLHTINISLDSLNADKFKKITRRDCFEIVMKSIRSSIDKGFHVKINAVLMRGINDQEVLDFIAWTRNEPIHIRFIEYMPFAGNQWDALKVISHQEILDRIAEEFDFVKMKDAVHDTSKKYKVIGHEGTFALISTMTQPFCSDCNRLRLTADGKMKNCLFSKGEADLLSALRKGDDVIGMIRQCVLSKKKERGGQLDSLENMQTASGVINRSMVRIGG